MDKETLNTKAEEQKDNQEKQNKTEQNNISESESLQNDIAQLNDKYLRLYAEFDNYQKRVQKEIENARESTKRELINEFLVILDNMEKALEIGNDHKDSVIKGIEITMKSFKDMLTRHGVKEINPQKEQFNPDLHDALMMQPSDELPKNMVLQTLEKGYMYKNKLIRPAKVVVSSGNENDSNNNDNQNINNKKED